jgi:hypothetical protein
MPSLKTRVYARGVLRTGTSNVGFIFCCPGQLGVNDTDRIYYTDGSYPGTESTLLTGSGTGINATNTNASYATVDSAYYRVVACGIRLRYIGTSLDMGGRLVALEQPDHGDIAGQYSFNTMLDFDRARVTLANRDWTASISTPTVQSELDYGLQGVKSNTSYLAIAVSSAEPAAPYEYEVVVHLEYTGVNVRGRTPTPASAELFSRVTGTVGNLATTVIDRASNHDSLAYRIADMAVSGVGPAVVHAAADRLGVNPGRVLARLTMGE